MSKRCELQKEYFKEYGNYKGKGKYDNHYVHWLENKVLALNLTSVSQQRELLEWLSDEDYFNIPKDEIDEILEDWNTYNSNCG